MRKHDGPAALFSIAVDNNDFNPLRFVMRSDRFTAVKFFDRADRLLRELEVYQILKARGIHLIAAHHIPELIGADEDLRTIEMTIAERPFFLDFAGAKLPTEIPDFDEEVMAAHYEHLRELFGAKLKE